MAGVKISELTTRLNTSQVCRAIPNLPCAIGQGMTVLMCAPQTSLKNNILATELFSKLGVILVTQEERLIDNATALAGGGPAYISYFAEALMDYAIFAGFDEANALCMVTQILRGTSCFLEETRDSPKTLYKKVMTPEGTTQKAIDFFDRKRIQTTIIEGIKQASMRSTALGRSS